MNDWIHQSLGVFVVITPFSVLSCRAEKRYYISGSRPLASPMKEPILVDIMIGNVCEHLQSPILTASIDINVGLPGVGLRQNMDIMLI